jgi:hypothetical protein
MTNFLDKKSKGELTGARRTVEAALAATPQRMGKQPLVKTSGPEIIDVPRVCAVHDKPYFASYARGRNGLFSFRSFRR